MTCSFCGTNCDFQKKFFEKKEIIDTLHKCEDKYEKHLRTTDLIIARCIYCHDDTNLFSPGIAFI